MESVNAVMYVAAINEEATRRKAEGKIRKSTSSLVKDLAGDCRSITR